MPASWDDNTGFCSEQRVSLAGYLSRVMLYGINGR